MRTAASRLLIVGGILAVLVLVLARTPVGWRLAAGLIERSVGRSTGLELSVGSLHGNLLADVHLANVRIAAPGGPTIARLGTIDLRYSLPALTARRIVVRKLSIDDAEFVFKIGPDGKLVGWPQFAGGTPTSGSTRRPWPVEVHAELSNWRLAFRDSARGAAIDVADLDVTLSGGPEAFEAAAEGSLRVAAGLATPVTGRFVVDIAGGGGEVQIRSVDVRTGVAELRLAGDVVLAPRTGSRGAVVDLAVEGSIDLAGVGEVIGLDGLRGRLDVTSAVDGPAGSPTYGASLQGEDLRIRGVGISSLAAELSGDTRALALESFDARLLGGAVRAEGEFHLPGGHDGRNGRPGTPWLLRLRAGELDLSQVASLIPEGAVGLAGTLDAGVEVASDSTGIGAIGGSFDVVARDLVVWVGSSVDTARLGELVLAGTLSNGAVSASGACCSTRFAATGTLGNDGLDTAEFEVDLDDLAGLAAAFGVADLRGTGSVTGSLAALGVRPTLVVRADVPDLSYRGVQVGPVGIDVEGAGGSCRARFRAFGGNLTGEATFEAGGRYELEGALRELDLTAVVPDSVREEMELEGTVSASFRVAGERGAVRIVEGTVTDLAAAFGGHEAFLEEPFRFRASRDSVVVSPMSFSGSFGSASVGGALTADRAGEIAARFRGVDLSAISDLVPGGLPVPLAGLIDGELTLSGSVVDPRVAADVSVGGLSVAGAGFDSLELEVESDSTDVYFELSVVGDGGVLQASGAVPVRPDSTTLLAFDPTREFGASVVCSDFSVDLGTWLLPNVRGAHELLANGSFLLIGRADSLGSLYGRGSFDELSVTFDLVSFGVVDTLEVEVDGGDVTLKRTVVGVTKRRVLGDEAGGELAVSGAIGRDGSLDLAVSGSEVDLGRILRTFGPRRDPVVEGTLDIEATVGGTLRDPEIEFGWELPSPVIYGMGFDAARGSGEFTRSRIVIHEAELVAGDRKVRAAGVVPVPSAAPAGEFGHNDFRITCEDLELGRLRPALPGLRSLKGTIDADLRFGGTLDAPSFEGTLALDGGSVSGFGLTPPIRDLSLEVRAGGGTIALRQARARAGRGTFEASGFVDVSRPASPLFLLKTRLRSAEIGVEDVFAAKLEGKLEWAGTRAGSEVSGKVTLEEAKVDYDVSAADLLDRRRRPLVIRRPDPLAAATRLNVDVVIEDAVSVESNVANLDLKGAFHLGGTALAPAASGGVYSDGGSFRYLGNKFELGTLSVVFTDPRRRDPFVDFLGTADVESRSGESYVVSVRFSGFALDAVPVLTSTPELSEPDIVALLTFGDTFGGLVSARESEGSSRDSFAELTRKAFVSRVFGVAEATLERLLHLDRVAVDEEAVLAGDLAEADVTIVKEFAGRLRVNYTTAVGRLRDQSIEVALELAKNLSIETRADPEGNHAIALRLRVPFR